MTLIPFNRETWIHIEIPKVPRRIKLHSPRWAATLWILALLVAAIGVFLLVCGPFFLVAGIVVRRQAGIVVVLSALYIIHLAQRAAVPTAAPLHDKGSSHNKILYFYSFRKPDVSSRTWGENRVRMMELVDRLVEPIGTLTKFGLGRNRVLLPKRGGAHQYYDHKKWKDAVRPAAITAKLIIVMLDTEIKDGLQWEIDTLLPEETPMKEALLEKAIYIVPPDANGEPYVRIKLYGESPKEGRLIAIVDSNRRLKWLPGTGRASAWDYATQLARACEITLGKNLTDVQAADLKRRANHYARKNTGFSEALTGQAMRFLGPDIMHRIARPAYYLMIAITIAGVTCASLSLDG